MCPRFFFSILKALGSLCVKSNLILKCNKRGSKRSYWSMNYLRYIVRIRIFGGGMAFNQTWLKLGFFKKCDLGGEGNKITWDVDLFFVFKTKDLTLWYMLKRLLLPFILIMYFIHSGKSKE